MEKCTAKMKCIPCDNGLTDCRIRAAAATAADLSFELNEEQKQQVRPRIMKRSSSSVTLSEISKYNATDKGPCDADLELGCQNTSCLPAAAATTTAPTALPNQEQTAQFRLLPRTLTRSRWTSCPEKASFAYGALRPRVHGALALLGPKDTAATDNGPCKPDLEACCQNIASLLAAAAAKSNRNNRLPVPTAGFIYGYMRVLFSLLQLEPECCVYSYIYIKRLQHASGLQIGPGNWRKLLIVTVLLATKFVDDVTMTNSHFAIVLNGWSLEKINRLESIMLQSLHWDIYVPISEYTKKYFELIQQPTSTCDWQVDARTIKTYFNVNQKQYYHFMLHGLKLQHVNSDG